MYKKPETRNQKPHAWWNLVITTIFSLAFLAACGSSSSSSSPTIKQGTFLDSAVEGLQFVSGGQSGTTDAKGTFSFEDGQTVRFSVGGIVIGEAKAESVMTPIELVLGAKDETDATVIKIIRFLQSIDDDGNLPNGIKISQAIRDIAAGKTINFLESELEFENEGFFTEIEIEAGTERGHPLLTAAEAQAHFKATLLRSLAGTYSGTFSGDDGGTWTFTLDDAGKFTAGSGNSNEDGAFTILNSGASATSNGAFVLGGSTSNGATFTGNITRSGEVSGTWQNNAFAEKGTFSGSKTAATVTAQGEAGGLTPIGSNTCSGGTFGCLTLSGTELGQDGTVLNVGGHLFIISPTTGKPLVLNWFEGIDGVGGRGLVVGFDGNGNIEGVGFVRTSVTTTSPSTIDKGYDCNVPSCSGLSHDPVAKTVTFNNLVLQPGTTPGNATATLTLNGTLSY